MECSQARELFVPYLMGALDSEDRESMNTHLENCAFCAGMLKSDGETMTRLASTVPQLEVPSRVKQRLLAQIDGETAQARAPMTIGNLTTLWAVLDNSFFTQATKAITTVVVLGIILGGVWFNARLNTVTKENDELSEQIASVTQENQNLNGQLREMAQRENAVLDMMRSQRLLTYEAIRMSSTPGTSVNRLSGIGTMAQAHGLMMVSRGGSEAILLAANLPPLPPDKVYQIWLIKDGRRFNAGLFNVDSTGYGQAVIIPYVSIAEFEAIGITIEPLGGSPDPTGTNVLQGDL